MVLTTLSQALCAEGGENHPHVHVLSSEQTAQHMQWPGQWCEDEEEGGKQDRINWSVGGEEKISL